MVENLEVLNYSAHGLVATVCGRPCSVDFGAPTEGAHALLMVLGRLRAMHSASRPSWQVWFHSVWFQALIEYEIIGGGAGVVRAGS